eukprot:1160880-Pelagomonas_calceolata.AAC.11
MFNNFFTDCFTLHEALEAAGIQLHLSSNSCYFVAIVKANGVRLHPSVNMLLEVGRERAKQRVQAMQWSEDE